MIVVRPAGFGAGAKVIAAAVSLLFLAVHSGFGEKAKAGPLVLTGATVIDGNGGPPLAGQTLVIEDGRIADVFPDGGKPFPSGADIRDAAGKFIVPGFIEAHVHIGGATDDRLAWALAGGVTGMREMAGDGAYLRDLQQAVERGEVASPDIIFSAVMGGPNLIQNDARVRQVTPPSFRLGTAPWARQVEETSDLPQVVREAKACGASALKLYADLSAGLVRRLTEEAHRQGMRVWAHSAISPANAEEIVAAGVDAISHAPGFLLPPDWTFGRDDSLALDPALLDSGRMARLAAEMIKHGTFFDPTLSIFEETAFRIPAEARERKRALWFEVVKRLHGAGVAIVAGTDCSLPAVEGDAPAIHREMRLLVEQGGLSPMEAITAATKNGARLLGLERTRGTVERGKDADLVVLNADPLADIGNTADIAFVIKRGKIVYPPASR